MAEQTFVNVYDPRTLDQVYVERQRDIEWRASLLNEATNLEAEAGPSMGTPEQVAGAAAAGGPPDVPGRQATGAKPSPVTAAIEALGQAAGKAAQSAMEGLGKAMLPGVAPGGAAEAEGAKAGTRGPVTQAVGEVAGGLADKVAGVRQLMLEGLMGLGLAPLIGAGAGVRQALENAGIANATAADPINASFLRMVTGGQNPLEPTLTPEERATMWAPMTLGEFAEIAVQSAPMWAPAAGAAAKVTGKKLVQQAKKGAPELAGERGALGKPPESSPAVPEGEGPRPLNLERIDASDAVKGVMKRLDELVSAGEPLKGHRETKSHAETRAEAKRRGVNLEAMMKKDPTRFLPDEATQTALRDSHNAVGQVLTRLEQLMAAGDQAARAEYPAAFAVALKLGELDVAAGTNLARSLESRKILSEGGRAEVKGMADLAMKIKDISGMAPEELAALRAQLTAAQQRKWYQTIAAGGRATRDLLHLAYLNGLLSDPTTTHVANLTGTALIVPWEMAVRQVAEIIHAVTSSDPQGVQLGETLAMARSLARANQAALQMASDRMRTGMQPFEQVNTHGPITAERYGFDSTNGFGRFVGTVGAALESRAAPVTWMGIEDAYMKGINAHLEGAALALRTAMAELPDGTAEAVQTRATFLEANPTGPMLAEMQRQANLRTLNNELGPAGQLFARFVDAIPLGRWILPFKRTPVNAAVWFKQNTPVLNLLGAKVYKDIVTGTEAEREMALARLSLGFGVGIGIAALVHNGTITGDGLTDPVLRKFRQFTDRPANTIGGTDAGDSRYTYDREDPVGGMIGAIATFEELRANVPQEQGWLDYAAAHMIALAISAGTVFSNKTYVTTLGNIIDSIKHPEQWGSKFTQGIARSLVPAALRHVTRSLEDNVVKEVNSVVDAFKSGIPLWASGVPAQRHPILSDPVIYPPGVVGEYVQAVRVYPVTGDPVMKALADHKVAPTPLPWYVAGRAGKTGPLLEEPTGLEGERLTVPERDRWSELIGTQKLDVGTKPRTLYEALHDLIRSTDYQTDWPPALRARELDKMYKRYRKAALKGLEEESMGQPEGIVARIEATRIRQAKALAPKSMQPDLNLLLQTLGR